RLRVQRRDEDDERRRRGQKRDLPDRGGLHPPIIDQRARVRLKPDTGHKDRPSDRPRKHGRKHRRPGRRAESGGPAVGCASASVRHPGRAAFVATYEVWILRGYSFVIGVRKRRCWRFLDWY